MLITSAIISGLGLGSMYGLIALGFHVTYVVSNTVNFSQGSAMMLGAVLGYTFRGDARLAVAAGGSDGTPDLRDVRRSWSSAPSCARSPIAARTPG